MLSDSKAFLKEEVLINWKISKSVTKDYSFDIWIRSDWNVAWVSNNFQYIV